MVLTGLLGLASTACGLAFAKEAFLIALMVGIIPGALLLGLTFILWRKVITPTQTTFANLAGHKKDENLSATQADNEPK